LAEKVCRRERNDRNAHPDGFVEWPRDHMRLVPTTIIFRAMKKG